jgi:hypothetical protein
MTRLFRTSVSRSAWACLPLTGKPTQVAGGFDALRFGRRLTGNLGFPDYLTVEGNPHSKSIESIEFAHSPEYLACAPLTRHKTPSFLFPIFLSF